MTEFGEISEQASRYFDEVLPSINELRTSNIPTDAIFIGAAGFEDRGFAFLNKMALRNKKFAYVFGIKYEPYNPKNRETEFGDLANTLTINKMEWLNYNRVNPDTFYSEFNKIQKVINSTNDIIIDVSSFSKFLIIFLLNLLSNFQGNIHIIYSEAEIYHPTQEKFLSEKENHNYPLPLPTFLTKDIYKLVCINELSSITMAGSPLLMIAFPTFNHQELGALLNEMNPQYLIEIEGVPHNSVNEWRSDAIRWVNERIEKSLIGNIKHIHHKEARTFEYIELVKILEGIYNDYKYSHKCVISPTGSKLQTIGVFVFNRMHPEIQLVYPIVKKFAEDYSEGYTKIWHLEFCNYSDFVKKLEKYNKYQVTQLKQKIEKDNSELIHILHLSDIHLGTKSDSRKYSVQLVTDLLNNLKIQKIDFLIISGDIGTYSTQEEYEAAIFLIEELMEIIDLNRKQIIVVPGNHDLNWGISEKAYKYTKYESCPPNLERGSFIPGDSNGVLLKDENCYKNRFDNFSNHFHFPIYDTYYPLEYIDQGVISTFPDNNILFLALNSSWNIDHYEPHRNRSHVNTDALSKAISQIIGPKYDGWLKIGVLHHPLTGREMIENEEIQELLADNGFKICLHGHIHKASYNFRNRGNRNITFIGAGTFGAPVKEQIPGIPLQYNLLRYDPTLQCITVETRKKEEPDGAWSADSRWGDINNPDPRYYIHLDD
ncbi:metallophosphoesterase family protein [Methanogenium organophilum]|uniref:Metallophosphoesterase n=1 Tax=Methanogenium organophilum TaxID=2199 RepID=A0A9X9T923_METOG|nr:metallophosphoesterase [Methanogenium organophilum]WAI02230.1 metallophosphoesterase [Methanogenium organophilum]